MKKNLNLCNKIRFNWIFIWIKLALEFFPKVTVFSLLNRFRGGKTFHSLGCNYPLRIAASLPITPLKLAYRVKKERRKKWQTWIRFVTIIKFTRAQFFCLNATKSKVALFWQARHFHEVVAVVESGNSKQEIIVYMLIHTDDTFDQIIV